MEQYIQCKDFQWLMVHHSNNQGEVLYSNTACKQLQDILAMLAAGNSRCTIPRAYAGVTAASVMKARSPPTCTFSANFCALHGSRSARIRHAFLPELQSLPASNKQLPSLSSTSLQLCLQYMLQPQLNSLTTVVYKYISKTLNTCTAYSTFNQVTRQVHKELHKHTTTKI